MALSLCNSQLLHPFPVQRRKFSTKIHSINQNLNQEKPQLKRFASSRRFRHISTVKSASVNGYPITKEDGVPSAGVENIELTEKLKKWVKFAREIFPGGDWWRLPTEDIGDVMVAKPVTVFRALKKMWDLIAEDRWVIFTAFVTLVITALSEISIPHYLTASIFSAQSSTIALFHRNLRLLVMLCITAAICRLRSFTVISSLLHYRVGWH